MATTLKGTIGGGTTFSASPATIKPKPQIYVVKGKAPWYSSYWSSSSDVVNIDESISGQATVTCNGKVNNMYGMFYARTSFTSLDMSRFDTSKVTNMFCAFYYCTSLVTLDLSSFITSNVVGNGMMQMFSYCSNLTTLDLSSFDTSKITCTEGMFANCGKLTTLDLSNFDTSKVTNMNSMFINCYSLTTIKGVIDMKSCKYYNSMFTNCTKLTGAKIKNPPSGFDGAGLSSSQYTIVS